MPQPSTAPAFGDSDIPALMADMGIAVTVGGVPGVALLNEGEELMVQDGDRGGVVILATTLIIQTSAFPAAKAGDAVVVNGKNFTIRQRVAESYDGGLKKFVLGI